MQICDSKQLRRGDGKFKKRKMKERCSLLSGQLKKDINF